MATTADNAPATVRVPLLHTSATARPENDVLEGKTTRLKHGGKFHSLRGMRRSPSGHYHFRTRCGADLASDFCTPLVSGQPSCERCAKEESQ